MWMPGVVTFVDGLTYEVFRVDDDVFRAALLCLFELVRSWATVPSVWRTAVVKPLHKSGSAEEFTNCRPISLLCCRLKIFERFLLKRLLHADVHVSAFMDVRKAFDVAWRNAVLVKLAESGITGSMWRVLDDDIMKGEVEIIRPTTHKNPQPRQQQSCQAQSQRRTSNGCPTPQWHLTHVANPKGGLPTLPSRQHTATA